MLAALAFFPLAPFIQLYNTHYTRTHRYTHRREKEWDRKETMPMDMCTAAARGRVDMVKALIAEDEEEATRVRWFDG